MRLTPARLGASMQTMDCEARIPPTAVLAAENARLVEELAQARQQQGATSEILRVISASQTDIQPVIDAIAHGAARLCGGVMAGVFRYDGTFMHLGAMINFAPGGEEIWRRLYPRSATQDTASGRAILECDAVMIPDVRRILVRIGHAR
jgi:two-component system, NtrC family, sensor kinase